MKIIYVQSLEEKHVHRIEEVKFLLKLPIFAVVGTANHGG